MKKSRHSIFIRFLLAFMAVMTTSVTLSAQNITVTGCVTDTEGEPLIGASVIAPGTGAGTATDIDGNYTLSVNPQGILQFSYVGYEAKTVQVDGRSTINVVMLPATALLDEVVVVGYGQMKKTDLTGAVGSIGAKDIKDAPVASVGQAMQGKVSGVQIIDAAKPGDNVNIKVRGLGSINNCDPLIVIDGVPTDLGINSINPQDIDRVDVLKDASATAIYGSRGANGVIMITTRRGAEGASKLSFSANVAVQSAAKKMKLLDAAGYASLNNDMMTNAGHGVNPEWIDPSELGAGTNWVDEMLQTGVMQNYNVSYSGGSDKAHYYFSAGFLDQSGIVEIDPEHGEQAVTHYEPLRWGMDWTLVQCVLETGRTHQIRVHMNHIGHPLPGDYLYCPEDRSIARQPLHSWKLEFMHPITGEALIFEQDMPEDMVEYMRTREVQE